MAAAAFAASSACMAQVRTGAEQGLGLTGGDIPPLLKQIQADPYRPPAEPACESIPREILALDQVLGPDVDEGAPRRSRVRDMATGAVRGMIPYRGWIRFITQAGDKDKKLQRAATAGYARRGFLRGLEANLHCAAEPTDAAPADAVVAGRAPAGEAIAARMVAERGPISEPLPPAAAVQPPGRDEPAELAAPLIDVPPPAAPGAFSDPRR